MASTFGHGHGVPPGHLIVIHRMAAASSTSEVMRQVDSIRSTAEVVLVHPPVHREGAEPKSPEGPRPRESPVGAEKSAP